MKKIIVTGGSGFIGTNIIEFLKEHDFEILNIDLKTPKLESHLKYWTNCDICDKNALDKIIIDFNPVYLVHLAARTDLNGKIIEEYQQNTVGVQNVVDALAKCTNIKRAIFASSMYVTIPGYKPKNFEDYAPHTVYGESKVLTEKIVKNIKAPYTWCIIRPTSIWGPHFGDPYDLFFKVVLSRRYLNMGSKACKKTYGYIDNLVVQVNALINADDERVNNQVFYLGDYEPYNITEWANEIANYCNLKIPTVPFIVFKVLACVGDFLQIFKVKFPMTSFRLKNMTTDNIHDLSKIQALVPRLPVTRLEGVEETINWINKNTK